MGAVDLVVQVEAPPSVASGLQRVGRAGHQVGEISRGVLFPKHRTDLIHCAVTVERMTNGKIEALEIPANPLDILAQQTVAATALEPLDVEQWYDVVRRSGSFATLPRSAYESTLDLLAGRYPSDEFAELRPAWCGTATVAPSPDAPVRSVWPSRRAARSPTAACSPSTWWASDSPGSANSTRMVYESRVGDVFALGATSWRIEEITYDRVLVSPAYGLPGRLPFWHGDGLGRPAELGEALGGFLRELSSSTPDEVAARLVAAGLDTNATTNLAALIEDQQQATGRVPTDRTLVVERFRDELGDWRLVLHSPYGLRVHAPWALAIGARLRERFGVDAAPTASDDGIIVRLPDTDDTPPGAELFAFERDEIEDIVTDEVGGSALFASRFRECAARALLLPSRTPGKRAPLWQQRQRSAQLLDVARKFPTFPILLETVRECLQDVYDLPALRDLFGRIARRQIRMVEVETATPSPFASSLLFDYVGAFMYEGDSPLAERRAAALSLDSTLLAELLGRVELRELLDADVIAKAERELQRLAPERHARDVEGMADLLRLLGPVTTGSRRALHRRPGAVARRARRAPARAARLVRRTPVVDGRRGRRPAARRTGGAAAHRYAGRLHRTRRRSARRSARSLRAHARSVHGVGGRGALRKSAPPSLATALRDWRTRNVSSRASSGPARPAANGATPRCCADLRRRSLAAAREEVEPVSTATLGRFLPAGSMSAARCADSTAW